jgi:hypothetical protein
MNIYAAPKYNIFKDEAYKAWIKLQPCLVCGGHYVDCHHVWHSGGKLANDYCGVPLCREHHSIYHQMGHDSFEEKFSFDLKSIIINYLGGYINEGLQQGVGSNILEPHGRDAEGPEV